MAGLLDPRQPQQQPLQPLLGAYQPNLLDSSRAMISSIMAHKPLESAGGKIAVGDVVEQGLGFLPAVGDLMSAADAVGYAKEGRPWMAGFSGLGALPIIGAVGDIMGKGVKMAPDLQKLFAKSKIVDAKGNPLPVYHGTNFDFDEFRPNSRGLIFFTKDSEYAKNYGEKLRKAYLKSENPLDLRAFGADEEIGGDAFRQALENAGVNTKGLIFIDGEPLQHISQGPNGSRLTQAIKDAGYDSVLLNEYYYGGGSAESIAVLSPDQIISTSKIKPR